MREVLYDILRLDTVSGVNVGKTAGGLKSSCEAALKKLEPFHPVPGKSRKKRFQMHLICLTYSAMTLVRCPDLFHLFYINLKII